MNLDKKPYHVVSYLFPFVEWPRHMKFSAMVVDNSNKAILWCHIVSTMDMYTYIVMYIIHLIHIHIYYTFMCIHTYTHIHILYIYIVLNIL